MMGWTGERGGSFSFFLGTLYFLDFFLFWVELGALGGRVGEGGPDIDEGKSIAYKLGIGEDPPV